MKKRAIAGLAAAAVGAYYATRFWLKTAAELRRYDHIRSLSNEGPFSEEAPDLLSEVVIREQDAVREWMQFMQKMPKEIARYMKIEAM